MNVFGTPAICIGRCSESSPTLVVFSDDWGRHPSSCQHLVRRLLNDHQVVWVNTIGTRPPRLDLNTLRRGAEKLAGWAGFGKRPSSREGAVTDTGVSPTVVSPVMWPSYQRRWQRRLNCSLVASAVNRRLAGRRSGAIAITTLPLSADLIGALNVGGWVYYCVDDLAEWPGLDAPTLRTMESELLAKADAVVSVSDHLQRRFADQGVTSTLITHGVDLRHWDNTAAALEGGNSTGGFAAGRDVLFWGLIDKRLESDWLLSLADQLGAGGVTLAGPVESLDARLASHPGVKLLGPVAYDELPRLADRAAVLVMPYRNLAATRAMQPLKLKEYMATGKPCVVRRLPATEEWSDCVDVVETCEAFVTAVRGRLADGPSNDQQAARQRLASESWEAKADQFRGVLASTGASRAK